jgi:hypothetical protein
LRRRPVCGWRPLNRENTVRRSGWSRLGVLRCHGHFHPQFFDLTKSLVQHALDVRPRDPNAPQLDGTGEILLESADRGAGYFTTCSDAGSNARTAGVYCRADPEDMSILDGNDDRGRAELIAERLRLWKAIIT